MECLLVKKINLDGDEANKSENNNLEDAEIANQLYNLHTKILRMFILTAFDMSRDILITPKRLLYAKDKENELYEQLMIIAKEKQEEIKSIIQNTIEQMKDNLVDKAANFVFKENTLFNLPTNYQHEDNYYYCNLLEGNQSAGICQSECFTNQNAKCLSDKCDSVLHSASDEQCWYASDEPDYQYIDQNQPEDESLILVNNDHNEMNHHINENLTNNKLRRHHSMQHRHNLPLQTCCHHHEQLANQQPRRANSHQHFKNYNSLNCNQQQLLNPQNTTQSTQYVSCEYADSGCASGNCCSSTCEQPFVQSDFHQRHSTANTASSNPESSNQQNQEHKQHHQSDNHLIVKQQYANNTPVKKESFLKRFTNKFAISSNSIVKQEPEKDYSQKVIEQLNELQIKDKQDYEDLKNHLSHLMHQDHLNKQRKLQHKLDQSQHHCQQSFHLNHHHSHHSSLVVNPRQIKITLKDLCAAQNEIQEYILSLLNKQIANDIVNSVNILKKNYIGTLERCLTALENGVSSIAQHEQLTTALAAAVEFDSPNKNLAKNVKRKISNKYNSSSNARKYLAKDCQQPSAQKDSSCSSFNNHHLNKNTRQQNSIDCDCSLSSEVSETDESSNSASDYDSTDEHNAETDDEYSFLNRTHHECSDALKQILTAAYQVEINLKTNSGFLKSYWDKIRQLVFNCTVTLWKLNYAPSSKSINQQNSRTFCTSCHSNLSLMDTNQHNLNNKTSSYNSCPPVFNLGNSSEIIDSCDASSLDCCEQTNCCCNLVVDCDEDNCADDDCCCDQGNNAGQADRPKFKRLRQTSLHSYVKIDQHTNQFLDSHCSNHIYNCHHSINPVDLINNKLQFDSIIDWKRKVALEVLSNLNLTRLSKSICGQFKEKLKQSHEQFSQAIRHLEQLHLEKRKRTEQQRSSLRKCFAPRIARFALEAICLKDQINYGMPKLGREIGRGQYGVVFQCCK